jgi:hypothetical protein
MGDIVETPTEVLHVTHLGGCSVVDYVIASANLCSRVIDFSVGELPNYSDHCPLHLVLGLSATIGSQDVKECTNIKTYSLVKPLHWDKQVCRDFHQAIQESIG